MALQVEEILYWHVRKFVQQRIWIRKAKNILVYRSMVRRFSADILYEIGEVDGKDAFTVAKLAEIKKSDEDTHIKEIE